MGAAVTVLICDGDQRRRVQLACWLDEEGYEVVLANSAAEVLLRLAETDYDCLLLDLLLPGVSGLDVLPIIRAHYPHLPVVAIAGENSLELERTARQRRVFYYLVESLAREEVTSVLRSATHRLAVGGSLFAKQEVKASAGDTRS